MVSYVVPEVDNFFFTLAQYAGGKEDNNFSHFGNKTLME